MENEVISSHANVIIVPKIKTDVIEVEDQFFNPDSSIGLPENPKLIGTANEVTIFQNLGIVFKQMEMDSTKHIVFTGHTDTSADAAVDNAESNFNLSGARALNVFNLVRGEKSDWVDDCLVHQKIADHKRILQYLKNHKACACDPVTFDDSWDDNAKKATKAFLHFIAGADAESLYAQIDAHNKHLWPEQVWNRVFEIYMEELAGVLGITLEKLSKLQKNRLHYLTPKKDFWDYINIFKQSVPIIACGKSYALTGADRSKYNYTTEKNRRVEILFFDESIRFDKKCPETVDKVHTKTECPLWYSDTIKRTYLEVEELECVTYHLQFKYNNPVEKKLMDMPTGIKVEAYEPDKTAPNGLKKITLKRWYKNGVYFIKVKKDPVRKEIVFGFETVDQCIVTHKQGAQPELDTVTEAQLSAKSFENRLKYYDLPPKWSSQNYWTRYDNDLKKGDLFENVVKNLSLYPVGAEVTDVSAPLVFCLDDIVLEEGTNQDVKDADSTGVAKPLGNDSRYTLFYINDNGDLIEHNLGDPDDPDGPQFTNTRFTKNLILDAPPTTKLIVFANKFYTVYNRRAGQVNFTPSDAHKPIQGCRAARQNDSKYHYNEALKYDDPTESGKPVADFFYYAKGAGNFELHYLHDACRVQNPDNESEYLQRSFLLVYWSCRFLPYDVEVKDKDGNVISDDIEIKDHHLKKFEKTGMASAMERWRKKGYTLEPVSPNNNRQIKYCVFFEAKKKTRGGRAKCFVSITRYSGDGSMSIDVGDLYYKHYKEYDYLNVGKFKDIDGEKYQVMTIAHEIGHAIGKDDEYSYQYQFNQYYRGMPYQYDDGSLMQTNRAPRMKQVWFYANWLNDASQNAVKLQPFLNNNQYKIVHRFNNRKLNFFLSRNPDYRCIYHPVKNDHALLMPIPNVIPASFKCFEIDLYKLGEDEYSWNIRIDGDRMNFAFDAIIVVKINIVVWFEGTDKDWDVKKAGELSRKQFKCLQKIKAVFTEELNNRFYISHSAGAHVFKNTYICFFPCFSIHNGSPDPAIDPEHDTIFFFVEGKVKLTDGKYKTGIHSVDDSNRTCNISADVSGRWIAHWLLGGYRTDDANWVKRLFNMNKIEAADIDFVRQWFCSAPRPGNANFKLIGK